MIICIVHSSPRIKGFSTNIAIDIANKFESSQILNIYLQKENIPYCFGCLKCVTKGIEYCPHSEKILPIRDKLLKADLIIIATPVYILHMSGQLKTFIDHFSSWFLMHRPEDSMFKKQLVVVATAAGPVYKKTLNEVSDCFRNFGIPKTYKIGFAISSQSIDKLSNDKKIEIDKNINRLVKKINKFNKRKRFHTPLKSKMEFAIYRKVQSRVAGEIDKAYWNERDWFKKGRPWKSN